MPFIRDKMNMCLNAVLDHLGTGSTAIQYQFHDTGAVHTIRGVIDERYEESSPGGELNISTNEATVLIDLKELPRHPERYDLLVWEGTTFEVFDIQEDSVAQIGVKLMLKRISDL